MTVTDFERLATLAQEASSRQAPESVDTQKRRPGVPAAG